MIILLRKENEMEKTINRDELLGYTVNGIQYDFINEHEVIIAGCELYEISDIDIPDEVEILKKKYKVIGVKEKAFYRDLYINALLLPSTIRSVGKYAFSKSGIRHIFFSQTLSTHEVVFDEGTCYDCTRLESLHLPAGLRIIPELTCANNVSLEWLDLPWRLKKIGDMAFYQCTHLKYFDFLPNIEEIGNSAFQGTNLHYAEIGCNTTTVGDLAFADIKNLHILVLDTWNVEVGEKFVSNNQEVSIYLADNEKLHDQIDLKLDIDDHHNITYYNHEIWLEDGIKYIWLKDKTMRIIGYSERELKPDLFLLERVGLSPVTSFETGFLNYSKKIRNIVFPSTITTLSANVFENCINLQSVTFRHNITKRDSLNVTCNDTIDIYYHFKEEQYE